MEQGFGAGALLVSEANAGWDTAVRGRGFLGCPGVSHGRAPVRRPLSMPKDHWDAGWHIEPYRRRRMHLRGGGHEARRRWLLPANDETGDHEPTAACACGRSGFVMEGTGYRPCVG